MDLTGYNIRATLTATAVSVVIGMIWYAPPLFGNCWQKHMGVKKPRTQMVAIWALSYLAVSFTWPTCSRTSGPATCRPGCAGG